MTGGGCSKLDVYDWFANVDMPSNYQPFQIMEVRFKGSRKDFYRNTDNIYVEAGELVCVESGTGGYDVGHVTMTGELVRMQMKKRGVSIDSPEIKKLYRKATTADVEKWKTAKSLEYETMHRARKIILSLRLAMKLSDVDYQGDKTKATFFYTADDRVDFRELIKKLAEEFRIRIEMRQIGMRQEASRLGGIGSCGRELCCSTWLTDFKTVSTSAARYQNLSLNTLKLAGQCGKLKCCLNFELDTYMDALKDFPSDLKDIKTKRGSAYVQKTDIFKKIMWFSYRQEETWVPLHVSRVNEIVEMNKRGEFPEDIAELSVVKPVLEKVLDYDNVVGQDSLTRMDDRNRRKKKSNNNRNKNKNQGPRNVGPAKEAGASTEPRQAGENPNPNQRTGQNNNRRNNNNRNRGGRNNPPNRPAGDKPNPQ
jgi:cell fate regulator YaaT (PSP1 superfamily)